jgi:hypothetical protein
MARQQADVITRTIARAQRARTVSTMRSAEAVIRKRSRALLVRHGHMLIHLAWMGAHGAVAPDPEASLVYVRELREVCNAILLGALRR